MEILSLGEKIKRKRKELNMTLKDLAKDRITPGQISLVESGRSNPSMDLLEYLASNLNITVEYLMESEESQAERICKYFEQISESYLISKNYLKSEKYIEKALTYATLYNLEYSKARIICLKAEANNLKGNFEEAKQLYVSAIIILSKSNNYEEIVKAFLNLGKISMNLKQCRSSMSYLKQAEAVYVQNNITNESLIGEIYYNISKVNYLLENINESKEYAYLAKEKYQQLTNKEEYANSLLLLSEESMERGDLEKATKYSKKSLEIYKEVSNSYNICSIENNLGELFYSYEDTSEADKHFQNALKSSECNCESNEVDILINICKNYIKTKKLDECEIMLTSLYKIIDEKDIDRTISLNLIKYRILSIYEKNDEAEKILIKSYNLAKERDKLKVAGELSILISRFYMDNKKEDLAKKFLDEGVRIFRNLGVI